MQTAKEITVEDVDDISSYGTSYSDEEAMEAATTVAGEDVMEPLESLQASIAAINATQTLLLEKLASLEKQVGTVQFDMTWVRDDMKGVHNVVGNIADHVCGLRDANAGLDRLRDQAPEVPTAKMTSYATPHMDSHNESPNGSADRAEPHGRPDYGAGQDPTSWEPDRYIDETQYMDPNVERQINVGSWAEEEGRNDLGDVRGASQGWSSPPSAQPRVNIVPDVVFEESQQLDMSFPSTQVQTLPPARSLWRDFEAVVKDWTPPAADASGRGEGWVSAKRGRGSSPEYGDQRPTRGKELALAGQGSLNLNLSPDKDSTMEVVEGRGVLAPITNTATTNKSGGRGAGRGTARGRGAPNVDPRFHSPVSFVGHAQSYVAIHGCRQCWSNKQEWKKVGQFPTLSNVHGVDGGRGRCNSAQIVGFYFQAMEESLWRKGLREACATRTTWTMAASGVF